MNAFVRNASYTGARTSSRLNHTYATSPSYRRLASQLSQSTRHGVNTHQRTLRTNAILSPLRSQFLPSELRLSQSRSFHLTPQRPQEEKPKPTEPSTEHKETDPKSEEEKKTEEGEKKKEGEEGEKKEGEDGDKKEKKEDLPPPPPHGDKTPWQVFTETMNSEFQASKEWNESTKQIAASANDIAESEAVRRAREARSAVSSAAGSAIKSTASVVGKGAAWTWDTSAMKAVRKGANVTGDALDKATKPIRETEAYKNVKDVIDDGSSSRYGGWVEKEERRKKREALDAKRGGGQVLQEDPE